MTLGEERFRFWFPITVMGLFAVYALVMTTKAYVKPIEANCNYKLEYPLPALRGSIFASNGEPLVISVPVWEYRLDPVALTNRVVRPRNEKRRRTREEIVHIIADALHIDEQHLMKQALDTKNRYQFIAESSDSEANRIIADPTYVRGVIIHERQDRRYTQKNRLAHVLGGIFKNNGKGAAGLELKYEALLAGIEGIVSGERDRQGHELYDRRALVLPPMQGADIHLTINNVLQYETECALADGVAEFGAAAGWCVIMDARNAAVLAMASLPTYDPSDYGNAEKNDTINRVTHFTYEPGSVMKVITAAAAFDSGFARPSTLYSTDRYTSRYYKLPGDGTHVWPAMMSVRDGIVRSSNIVIGKLGYDMGPFKLYKYFTDFGFGQRTGIELLKEDAGIVKNPNKKIWDKASWSRAPIGQSIAVTAMQLASAYQAIANDGVRMRPHLVTRIVGSDGDVIYRHVDEPLNRPITPETARTMREVMSGITGKLGTGKRARVRGYSIAGKTGTAQKPEHGIYVPNIYRATFCAMLPAMTPRLVILITLDFDQKRQYHQGGNSSAVIFRRLATTATRILMIPPDKPEELEGDSFDELESDEVNQSIEKRTRNVILVD